MIGSGRLEMLQGEILRCNANEVGKGKQIELLSESINMSSARNV